MLMHSKSEAQHEYISTCFTSTKVHILTGKEMRDTRSREEETYEETRRAIPRASSVSSVSSVSSASCEAKASASMLGHAACTSLATRMHH